MSKAVIYIYVCCCCLFLFANNKDHTLIHDKAGYYVYLPAIFINNDLQHLRFYENLYKDYKIAQDDPYYATYQDTITHRRFTKYPAGTAIMELPFFLLADAYCSIMHHNKLYGYSPPYQVSVCIATFIWMIAGLWVLRKLLLLYFNDRITGLVLAFTLFSTNLFCYATYEAGMSHAFSFSLFCFLLYATDRWYATTSARFLYVAAVALGLITITRPTNSVVVLVLIFYNTNSLKDVYERLLFYKQRVLTAAVSLLLFVGVVGIQLSYWKYITNHWFVFAYKEEHFDFSTPHILDGLFSYNKGWMIYTPLAYVYFAGLGIMVWRRSKNAAVFLLFTALNLYIVFSWFFWPYGWGFSARALIESYAILSIPLGYFLKELFAAKQVWLRSAVFFLLFFILALNIFQTYQYTNNILPGIWIDKTDYWKLFGRLHPL